MYAMGFNIVKRLQSPAVTSIFTLTCLLNAPAQATTHLIDFDDLVQAPCTEEICEPLAVNNQYSHLGVNFVGGALYAAELSLPPQFVSPFNALTDWYGPSLEIHFNGVSLPTTVSMYVSAYLEDSVFLTAYGNNGQVDSAVTDGWRGTEETSTPYRDKQLVSLYDAEGISQINIETLFSRRGTLIIDNLQFGDELNVPIPASGGLLASALSCLWLRRRAR